MDVRELIDTARDTIGTRRVFGEPIERDGTTLIPAARVGGGGGGGSGHDAEGQAGEGGGFGVGGRPAGAYVIRDGEVTWRPAVDLNTAVVAGAVVLVAWLATRVRLAKIRARHHEG